MILTILKTVLGLLILLAIGFLCSKLGLIDEGAEKKLTDLLLKVIQPVYLFMAYQRAFDRGLLRDFLICFALAVAAFLAMILISHLFFPKGSRDREVGLIVCAFPNVGFMGIPLISGIYGTEGVFFLTTMITVFNVLIWTYGIIVMSGDHGHLRDTGKRLLSPALIAIAVGLVCFSLGLLVPEVVAAPLNQLCAMHTPLAMLISGAVVARADLGRGLKDLSDYTNAAQLTENEKDKRAAAALWILRTQTAMAENALETGDNEQAVSILQPALDYCLADVNIGRKNLVTSRVYLILARAEQAQGQGQDALDYIDMAMRIQLNLFNFSGEYPGLTEVYQAYGQILMEKGSSFEGGAYFQKALALAQASYGKNHALTAKAYDQKGLYEMKQGNASPAVEAFSEAVEIRRNILGYQHPETVRYLCHLAQAAEKSGDPDKTKEASLEAKRLCEQLKLQGELAEQVNAL